MTNRGLHMFGRRQLAGFAAVFSVLAPAAAWAEDTDQAEKFVAKLLKDLSAVVNGGKPVEAQKAAMRQIVFDAVDVDGVARFCLGRFWRTATPQQQKDYTEIFRNVMVSNITGKVGEYQGVSFTMGKGQARAEEISVASTVNRPGNAPNKVDWLVAAVGGKPKVIDVMAEGTSLRLTQRNDYSAFLQHNSNDVQALIEALKKQAIASN
jgi:phospholipid transport system substrate-binding protein